MRSCAVHGLWAGLISCAQCQSTGNTVWRHQLTVSGGRFSLTHSICCKIYRVGLAGYYSGGWRQFVAAEADVRRRRGGIGRIAPSSVRRVGRSRRTADPRSSEVYHDDDDVLGECDVRALSAVGSARRLAQPRRATARGSRSTRTDEDGRRTGKDRTH